MNIPKKQAISKSLSREGRREATANARRNRAAANDLSHNPNFDLQYGDDYRGGHPCDYYTLQYRGVSAHLRFDGVWMVRCPMLGIEQDFANQAAQDLAKSIENWIDEHLPAPAISTAARLRQSTQAVCNFSAQHNIPLAVADEIMLERAF